MPLFVPQSVIDDYETRIANLTEKADNYGYQLTQHEHAIKDMDRLRANLEHELSQAKATIITRERELAERRHHVEHLEDQLMLMRRQLMEVQEKAAQIQQQNLAMQSLQLWTRKGKGFVKVTAGMSPVTESDPIIHQLAHASAMALVDELHRRAGHGEPVAQILVARTKPLEIEHHTSEAQPGHE